LPLGEVPTVRTGTAVYGVAALDCHGRIADRAVLRALGWTPGVRLGICATRDLVTVRARLWRTGVQRSVACDHSPRRPGERSWFEPMARHLSLRRRVHQRTIVRPPT
jgi:hypothetical protein